MIFFLKKVLSFILLIGFIFISNIVFRYYLVNDYSWKLDPKKHVLFMGASHIQRGINDSMMISAVNYASSSERYMYTYLKFKEIIKHNPQVDTVFLQCAETDLWEHTDDKYFEKNEMSVFIYKYFPLFTANEWGIFSQNKKTTLTLLAQKSFSDYPFSFKKYYFGGYEPICNTMNISKIDNSEIKGTSVSNINIIYLREIINICLRSNIKLYLLHCPVYEPGYGYDQKYFKSIYNKYFSNVELIDYSKIDIPVTYFSDPHHLNRDGALYLTNKIKNSYNID